MTKKPRRNHRSAFKAKVALEALKDDQTLVELSERFQIHPNLITEWKKVLLGIASEIFYKGKPSREPDVTEHHTKIGQLAMENDFIQHARAHRRVESNKMIEKEHPLPVTKQCQILELFRPSLYYMPAPVSYNDRNSCA